MSEENRSDESASTDEAAAPDIDQVRDDDWPKRDFPITDGRRRDAVRIVVRQSLLNDIYKHGREHPSVEVCGVLVGNGYRDERGPFVYLENNIRGQHSDSQTAQVTFTADTWNQIQNEMDRDFPDLRILGWYHTHPGFGIFLSGMDLFIHENFFNGNEQLAFVYDPSSGEEGMFVWRSGTATREGFMIEQDDEDAAPIDRNNLPDEHVTAGASDGNGDVSERIKRLERRSRWTIPVLICTILFSVASPFLAWNFAFRPEVNRSLERIIVLFSQALDMKFSEPAIPPVDNTELPNLPLPKQNESSADDVDTLKTTDSETDQESAPEGDDKTESEQTDPVNSETPKSPAGEDSK